MNFRPQRSQQSIIDSYLITFGTIRCPYIIFTENDKQKDIFIDGLRRNHTWPIKVVYMTKEASVAKMSSFKNEKNERIYVNVLMEDNTVQDLSAIGGYAQTVIFCLPDNCSGFMLGQLIDLVKAQRKNCFSDESIWYTFLTNMPADAKRATDLQQYLFTSSIFRQTKHPDVFEIEGFGTEHIDEWNMKWSGNGRLIFGIKDAFIHLFYCGNPHYQQAIKNNKR